MATTLQNGSFYGRSGASLRLDDVVLTETTYTPGFVVPLHAHEQPFFCIALRGAFVEHLERTRRVLEPRAAFYHPMHHDHAETFEHGAARLFNVQLGAGWLRRMQDLGTALPDYHVPLAAGRAPQLGLMLHDEFRLGGERLIVEGLLLALVGELVRAERKRERSGMPSWMRDVVALIHEVSPLDPGLASLARAANVHPAHLARTFRTVHGCTPGEYARRLRVARARELLAGTRLTLARVAARCGFADQSHFTRVFRRAVGVTPAAYRRGAAGGRKERDADGK